MNEVKNLLRIGCPNTVRHKCRTLQRLNGSSFLQIRILCEFVSRNYHSSFSPRSRLRGDPFFVGYGACDIPHRKRGVTGKTEGFPKPVSS